MGNDAYDLARLRVSHEDQSRATGLLQLSNASRKSVTFFAVFQRHSNIAHGIAAAFVNEMTHASIIYLGTYQMEKGFSRTRSILNCIFGLLKLLLQSILNRLNPMCNA